MPQTEPSRCPTPLRSARPRRRCMYHAARPARFTCPFREGPFILHPDSEDPGRSALDPDGLHNSFPRAVLSSGPLSAGPVTRETWSPLSWKAGSGSRPARPLCAAGPRVAREIGMATLGPRRDSETDSENRSALDQPLGNPILADSEPTRKGKPRLPPPGKLLAAPASPPTRRPLDGLASGRRPAPGASVAAAWSERLTVSPLLGRARPLCVQRPSSPVPPSAELRHALPTLRPRRGRQQGRHAASGSLAACRFNPAPKWTTRAGQRARSGICKGISQLTARPGPRTWQRDPGRGSRSPILRASRRGLKRVAVLPAFSNFRTLVRLRLPDSPAAARSLPGAGLT